MVEIFSYEHDERFVFPWHSVRGFKTMVQWRIYTKLEIMISEQLLADRKLYRSFIDHFNHTWIPDECPHLYRTNGFFCLCSQMKEPVCILSNQQRVFRWTVFAWARAFPKETRLPGSHVFQGGTIPLRLTRCQYDVVNCLIVVIVKSNTEESPWISGLVTCLCKASYFVKQRPDIRPW